MLGSSRTGFRLFVSSVDDAETDESVSGEAAGAQAAGSSNK
jgi:hypothetical protein